MPLKPGQNLVKEKVYVYVVRGTPKLLLGILAIRHLGLIHDILGKYVIKAIEENVSPPPLRSKEDVLKAYPKLFTGLGKQESTTFDWMRMQNHFAWPPLGEYAYPSWGDWKKKLLA